MASFDRQLSSGALASLERLTSCGPDNWWRELLRLWAPNGHEGELRLAIRNGSLNFYSKGQSVAQVSFDASGSPRLRVHRKYVTGDPDSVGDYISMNERGRSTTDTEPRNFEPSEIRLWIKHSAEHRGTEKCFVENAVAESPSVIDLEMGLPANTDQPTSLRVDIVALERHASETRIVFWEAKMIGDPRLSAPSEKPEVLEQLQRYAIYLADPEREKEVIDAYRRNCRLLLDLHGMAARILPKPSLDLLVCMGADPGRSLTLEKRPRLLIFDDGRPRREERWEERLETIRASGTVARVMPHRPYALS